MATALGGLAEFEQELPLRAPVGAWPEVPVMSIAINIFAVMHTSRRVLRPPIVHHTKRDGGHQAVAAAISERHLIS
jgi:hypothetical protein